MAAVNTFSRNGAIEAENKNFKPYEGLISPTNTIFGTTAAGREKTALNVTKRASLGVSPCYMKIYCYINLYPSDDSWTIWHVSWASWDISWTYWSISLTSFYGNIDILPPRQLNQSLLKYQYFHQKMVQETIWYAQEMSQEAQETCHGVQGSSLGYRLM